MGRTGGPVMYDNGPVQDRILSAAQEYKADERLRSVKAEMQFFARRTFRPKVQPD